MKKTVWVAAAASIAALLTPAVSAHADTVALDSPTHVVWVDGSAGAGRWGYLRGFVPESSTAAALVYTYADDAPAPDPTPDAVHAMSTLGLGTSPGEKEAWSGTENWSILTTRNFAVYATDGAGNFSAPSLLSVAAMTDSPTDPGPIQGLTMDWTWSGGEPAFFATWPLDLNIMSTFLSLGANNPAPGPWIDLTDSSYHLLGYGYQGTGTSASYDTYAGLPKGTALTFTVFRQNAALTHYTREAHTIYVGSPTRDVVTVTGPTAIKKVGTATFTAQVADPSFHGTYYPTPTFTIQTRTWNGSWITRQTVTGTSPAKATVTLPAVTQGYRVRAILTTGGAGLISDFHTVTLNRTIRAAILSRGKHGSTMVLSGSTTGVMSGQPIVIKRCATLTSGCTVVKTVRASASGTFTASVPAPASAGARVYYRARLEAIGTWTPFAITNRLLVIGT